MDPLAEMYAGRSPYEYALSNPVRFIDPTGMGPEEGESEGELYADASQINLGNFAASDINGGKIGSKKVINLFFHSPDTEVRKVYGNVTIKLYPNDKARIYQDTYDFDYKSNWNPLNWPRNVATAIGDAAAGIGKAYNISFYSESQLKTIPKR